MSMTATILVVDDQRELLSSLELTLSSAGYRVLTAENGLVALELLRHETVHLILADIAMPRINGYQLYEQVRENPRWVPIPFLFLTARTLDSDIRFGKELGVDDYLSKPIQPEDLLATVYGKLRRAQQLAQSTTLRRSALQASTAEQTLKVGSLKLDPDQHQVWLQDNAINLSAREFTLLEYLARRANMVVAPQELIRATHQLDTDQEEAGSLLRPLIRSLRRKLGYPVGDIGCIRVVRGVGYRLVPPE